MGNPGSPNNNYYSDEDLWQLLRNGSQEAISLLVYRYYDDLLRYGCSFCQNTLLVEDLIQDLFCDLCQKPGGLSHVQHIKPYLFISLRRRLFRQMKQERRQSELPDNEGTSYEFDMEFSAEDLIVRKEQSEELRLRMANYLQQLSPRQREAIYLRFYENLSYDQISQVMDISIPYLYLLIHKSIGRIRLLAGIGKRE